MVPSLAFSVNFDIMKATELHEFNAATRLEGSPVDKKVTLRDIAKEANLSVSAVSLVLNNQPCRISPENKELIRSIAKRDHYHANQIARSLVTRKTSTLGLILPDIENLFFSSLAKNLEENCRREGYALIITNTDDQYQVDRELLQMLAARGVDGLFLIVSNESYRDNSAIRKEISALPVPCVMVDRIYPDFPCSRVLFDNEQGAYLAVKNLLQNGHRKIGCIANTTFSNNGLSRLNGYRRAMKEFGCEIKPAYIIEGDYHIGSGYRAGRRIRDTDVTAIFVCNDMMTLGMLKCFTEDGIRVPTDYSVVSYDNTPMFSIMSHEITSVEQNVTELGDHAFRIMLDILQGRSSAPVEKVLTPKLILKDSVCQI